MDMKKGPYSKFRVGACLITTSGEYIFGANIENASYPVGVCAERVALGTALVYPPPPSYLLEMGMLMCWGLMGRCKDTDPSKQSPSLRISNLARVRVGCVGSCMSLPTFLPSFPLFYW